MSKTTNRDTASKERDSVDQRLALLLDAPFLARVVPHLAPETLHQLIRYRGLEECGEVLTCATPTQLTELADLDLWRHPKPGRDDQFDVDRFGEWLEVLVETGDSAAARTVAAMNRQLVIMGLSRYVRVFDPGTFEPTASTDDEVMDRHEMMNSETDRDVVECEVGGYLVRARRSDGWDAIVTLLIALDLEQNDDFHALMQGCRDLSNSTPELDGLDDLLLTPEQHLHDAAIEREQRRSQRGYATPADARAFLQMARTGTTSKNPIARAYFRAVEEKEETTGVNASPDAAETGTHDHEATDVATHTDPGAGIPASIDAVIELLTEAGLMPERPRALLGAAADDPRAAKLPQLRRLMEFLLHHDENIYLTRSHELAFLANTLTAGCSIQSRPFTPEEASEAAACICNLGLERQPAIPPDTFLVDHDLVAMFEAGWSMLYQDVSLFAADRLIGMLDDIRCGDADVDRELSALGRTLQKERAAGTPWRARDAAEVLATLDLTAWISVLGLLDECPVIPAALTAILEHRTKAVSPTAFQFISTTAQLGNIRVFMSTLPNLLMR